MSKYFGGPAFPVPTGHDHFSGMSLRDYFAARAMAAYLTTAREATKCAEWAYLLADAMLTERDKD